MSKKNSKGKIKFPYFPKGLIFVTPLLLIAGGYLFFIKYPIGGLVLSLIGIIVLTTSYITEIDLRSKCSKDYLFFLGFNLRTEVKRFNRIDRIIITRGQHKHTSRILGAEPAAVSWSEFTGTVLFDNGELELMTKKNKRELIIQLKDLAEFLNVQMEDRSGRGSFEIDLARIQ